MDCGITRLCVLLDFVALLGSDGDLALSLLLGDRATRLATAPVPRD